MVYFVIRCHRQCRVPGAARRRLHRASEQSPAPPQIYITSFGFSALPPPLNPCCTLLNTSNHHHLIQRITTTPSWSACTISKRTPHLLHPQTKDLFPRWLSNHPPLIIPFSTPRSSSKKNRTDSQYQGLPRLTHCHLLDRVTHTAVRTSIPPQSHNTKNTLTLKSCLKKIRYCRRAYNNKILLHLKSKLRNRAITFCYDQLLKIPHSRNALISDLSLWN